MKYGSLISYFFILIIILSYSCNSGNEQGTPEVNTDRSNDTAKVSHPDMDTVFQKALYPGGDTLYANLELKQKDARVDEQIDIKSGDSLIVELSSTDPKANIRITQIEKPDSTFDGPWGRTLRYRIMAPGMYRVIMGPNMMAGDPWEGQFRLKAWVK